MPPWEVSSREHTLPMTLMTRQSDGGEDCPSDTLIPGHNIGFKGLNCILNIIGSHWHA